MVVGVNKMDLVDYSQEVFEKIADEFSCFAMKLEAPDLTVIPISALHGDNIVARSANMPWYDGPSLLHHLEQVHIASDRNLVDVRFPVQYVIRPHNDSHHDYRGYAGQLAAGVLRVGDEIVVQPSGLTSKVAAIDTYDGPLTEAYPPMSVTVRLEDDIDVSRGNMLCRPHNQPTVGQDIEAMVCWLTDRPLQPNGRYALKHTTRTARAVVKDLRYRLHINTPHPDEECTGLGLNEMGRLHLRVTAPLMFDDYRRDRATGSFILVDETTNATAGAGLILGPA